MRSSLRTRRGRRVRIVAAGALALSMLCQSQAWSQAASAPIQVELQAQSLADALKTIARQAGVSILFEPGSVSGRQSPSLSGRLTPLEAVTRVLEGSGLVAEVMQDGSLVVRAPGVQPTSGSRAGELDRVYITGTRLSRIVSEGPAPVDVYSREEIERSGQPTLERFLSSLNEVSASQGEGAFGSTVGQSTVQLRGLPLGETLVLINGRRLQAVGSSSANFFDLSLIPMAAIERVEIVPVGSSAVYGGDALAGVVNIILRKSLSGPLFSVGAGTAKGTRSQDLAVATGGEGSRGHYLVMGSYARSTPLNMSERSFFRDADYRRFGGPDARTRSCTPGTVSSTTGGNLPGLESSFAVIPRLSDGQSPDVSDFQATSGQANLCNRLANGNGYALSHGRESFGLHATGDVRFGETWSAFAEVMQSRERVFADEVGLSLNNVLVPAGNPYNPFGEAVRVTASLGPENGSMGFKRVTNFTRLVAGLRGEIGAGWDTEVTLSTTRDNGRRWQVNSVVDAAARGSALGSTSADTALNPFTAGRAASDDVLDDIWSDSYRTSRGKRDQITGFVRGDLAKLPMGTVELIVGGEQGRDTYATAIPGDVDIQSSRHASAVFGELRAPLWKGREASGPEWSRVALTLAGRRDHYSDFGSAGTYQAGLEFRPTRDVLFRASTATSFKPPTLLQTQVDGSTFPADLFGLTDPARDNEPVTSGEVVRGANPDLRPEHGRAYSFGGLWEPAASPGTRLGLTAWRVKVDGLISVLLPQTALDHEDLFPGFIERGPSVDGRPGPVTRVLYAEVNFGGITTSGLDLEASHAWSTPWGRVSLAGSASRTNRYKVVLAPGAPEEDRLGRRFADYWSPRWKGRLSAAFERDAFRVGLTSRYLGDYLDSGTSDRKLGDFWIHDLAGGVDLKRLDVALLNGLKSASLTLGIVNLFDRRPQFVGTSPYYDVTQADWRGRYTNAKLTVSW